MRGFTQWRWHLDEVFVKINGKFCYLWRAVDHEGEVLETVVTAKRDKAAAALEQLVRSRLSVLIGPAGTGKTTLLRMVCSLPDVAAKGLLLLAPTGKARVRLEAQTGLRGSGLTLAQFLNRLQRYDGATGAYFPRPRAPRCGDYRTVIVDECSMLTEEQFAALIDSLSNVERLVLVGDPRQLRRLARVGRSSTS
jgi:ATP-dependent exoDNAse (exonuclease V) alpha subunit